MHRKPAWLAVVFGAVWLVSPARAIEEAPKSQPGAVLSDSDSDYRAVEKSNPLAAEAVERIRAEFESVRLQEKDFKLSPGWELPFTISAIENFFSKPLDIPRDASRWSDALEAATKKSDLFSVAKDVLMGSSTSSPSVVAPLKNAAVPSRLPVALKAPVKILAGALLKAQPLLDRAVDSVPSAARLGFLTLNDWPDPNTGAMTQEISAKRTKEKFEAMKPFPQADVLHAADILFHALDEALPLLQMQTDGARFKNRIRWRTPGGVFLVSGPGDDVYDGDDLKGVTVLIDLGGKNIYKVPVAAAHEKEVRVVIDFGSDVVVDGKDDIRGNAGCGVFGIGILVLANPHGTKQLQTGPFSQGVGMAGVGALFVNGTAHLTADRNVQGAGVFGVGLLSVRDGKGSTYLATRSGQGCAFTRGVGIFVHEGDDADIKGGLVQPDPREPLGSVSMCQGVGFGPRAYTGGGLGLAVVKGNNVSVKGSYFSQGVGYWHGMGVFRLRGDHCTLQARRYDMGSGVHSAFGHFDVYGNANRVLNWGVGPSYGWDHAVGSSLIQGDDNEMQTEWGAGTAQIGSLSFSYYRQNRGKLKLCDHGTSNFVYDEPSYSLQVLDGTDNRLQCQGTQDTGGERLQRLRTPWGVLRMKGTVLDDNLKLQPPEWPEFPRQEEVQREMVDLQARLEVAQKKPLIDQVADLVDIAAAFSLDKVSPRQALKKLLTLRADQVPFLVDAIEPAATDQLIQLSIAIPAQGDALAKTMTQRLKDDTPLQKKSVMVNFLRMFRPSTVFPPLLEMLKDPAQEKLRGTLLRTMGHLLNKDTGEEPGARAVLSALALQLSKPKNKAQKEKTLDLLKKLRFGESFGLLAAACELEADKREEFFESAPDDLTGVLQIDGAKAFLKILGGARRENLALINKELVALDEAEPVVRSLATVLFTSTRAATVYSAVVALGQIAYPHDAELMEPLLNHESAQVREAAAVALGRMGEAAVPIFERVMASGSLRARALAMVGITQTVSEKAVPVLEKGIVDADPSVRLTALAALDHYLPEVLQPRRTKLISFARKKLSAEKDPDVKLALQLLK